MQYNILFIIIFGVIQLITNNWRRHFKLFPNGMFRWIPCSSVANYKILWEKSRQGKIQCYLVLSVCVKHESRVSSKQKVSQKMQKFSVAFCKLFRVHFFVKINKAKRKRKGSEISRKYWDADNSLFKNESWILKILSFLMNFAFF